MGLQSPWVQSDVVGVDVVPITTSMPRAKPCLEFGAAGFKTSGDLEANEKDQSLGKGIVQLLVERVSHLAGDVWQAIMEPAEQDDKRLQVKCQRLKVLFRLHCTPYKRVNSFQGGSWAWFRATLVAVYVFNRGMV